MVKYPALALLLAATVAHAGTIKFRGYEADFPAAGAAQAAHRLTEGDIVNNGNFITLCRGGGNHGDPCNADADCPGGSCTRLAHRRLCLGRRHCNVHTEVACTDNLDCDFTKDSNDNCERAVWGGNQIISCTTDADCGICVGDDSAGEACNADSDCIGTGTCDMGLGQCGNGFSQCQAGVPALGPGVAGDIIADGVVGNRTMEDDSPGAVTPQTLDYTYDIIIDEAANPDRLYIADTTRVTIRLGSQIAATNSSAEFCIGQKDCNYALLGKGTGNRIPGDINVLNQWLYTCETLISIDDVRGLTVVRNPDHSGLWVTDKTRALHYPLEPISDACADRVLGDTDMAGTHAAIAASFALATDIATQAKCTAGTNDGTPCTSNADCTGGGTCKTWIAITDRNDNRVMLWKGPPTADGQAPDAYIGQTTSSGTGSGCTQTQVWYPSGAAFSSSGYLWITDRYNHRVLRYGTNPSTGASADKVLGQTDYVSCSPDRGTGVAANTLEHPEKLNFDSSGNLWVIDRYNHRALRFDSADSLTNGASASIVLGQPDFTTESSGTTAAKLNWPTGIDIDSSGNVWIADGANLRALRFSAPITSGQSAGIVQGQTDFTSKLERTADAKTFARPNFSRAAFAGYGGQAFFGDSTNHRVLVWNDYNTALTFTDADYVVGQSSFTARAANQGGAAGQSTLNDPRYIDATSTRLAVPEDGNDRVLEFAVPVSASGPNAVAVYGQSSYTATGCNNGGISATSLCDPRSARYDADGNLWVTDTSNGRVLVYCATVDTVPQGGGGYICTSGNIGDSTADVVIGKADFVTGGYGNYDGCKSPTASTLCRPDDAFYDTANSRLFVVDRNYWHWCSDGTTTCNTDVDCTGPAYCAEMGNRLLIYTSVLSNGEAADIVLGVPGGTFTKWGPQRSNDHPTYDFGSYWGVCSGGTQAGAYCPYEDTGWDSPTATGRRCVGGTNEAAACTSDTNCTGGGTCGCPGNAGTGGNAPVDEVICDRSRGFISGQGAVDLDLTSDWLYVANGNGMWNFVPPFTSGLGAISAYGITTAHKFASTASGYTPCQWDGSGGITVDPYGHVWRTNGGDFESLSAYYQVLNPFYDTTSLHPSRVVKFPGGSTTSITIHKLMPPGVPALTMPFTAVLYLLADSNGDNTRRACFSVNAVETDDGYAYPPSAPGLGTYESVTLLPPGRLTKYTFTQRFGTGSGTSHPEGRVLVIEIERLTGRGDCDDSSGMDVYLVNGEIQF